MYISFFQNLLEEIGLSSWLNVKEPTCQCRRCGFYPWVWKIPRMSKWQPTPVFLPGKSHGQKTLAGCSPGVAESDTTEHLSMHFQFSSVQSCLTLCDPMNHSTPGLPVHHKLLESSQTHVHWVGDAIQPSHPLSSPSPLPPIPPSIRVFSSESTLRMRWPKYCSFNFSISPSNEHPGLISFRMDKHALYAMSNYTT